MSWVSAGIAYLDPGNLESQLQAGAQAGYDLIWVLLWVIVMVSPQHAPAPFSFCLTTLPLLPPMVTRAGPVPYPVRHPWLCLEADDLHSPPDVRWCLGRSRSRVEGLFTDLLWVLLTLIVLSSRGAVQGYLMQILAVKLGVATGTNMAQQCR